MPKGPKGERRPADVIGNAVHVMRIATGEIAESAAPEKNPAAVALGKMGGRKGGLARAQNMTPKQRQRAARSAVAVRWGTKKNGKSIT